MVPNTSGKGKNVEVTAKTTSGKALVGMEVLEALRRENEALRAKLAIRQTVTLKVSEKGAVSMYGLGRFPVTLYAGQWERVLSHAEDIKRFIADNAERVARKDA